jgi:hypothetical protein
MHVRDASGFQKLRITAEALVGERIFAASDAKASAC